MNINFAQKRFGYTYGDELYTINDESYVGFYNTLSGSFYTGRDITPNSSRLFSKDKIETDFIVSNYFKDRVAVFENISLPYSEEDLLVPPNEFITYTSFGNLMERIHKNTLYLYSKLFFANNNLPSGDTRWAGISADIDISTETGRITATTSSGEFEFKCHSGGYVADTVNSYEIGWPDLDLIRKIQIVKTESDNNIIFGVTSNRLITLSSNSEFTTITVSSSSRNVDNNSELRFKNIADISIYDNKCYIVDNSKNIIYKYNISSFLFDNPENQKFFLEESVGGGRDQSGQKFLFNKISCIDVSKSKIFVKDSEKRVRVLDKNFSWITDIIFEDSIIISLKYNEFHNFLLLVNYDLNERRKYFVFITLDNTNILLGERLYFNLPGSISRIKFSSENSNIMYIAADNNIYKYFLSNTQNEIGKWRLENLGINFRNIWNYIDKLDYDQITFDWDNLTSLTVSDNNGVISVIRDFDITSSDDSDRIIAIGNTGPLNPIIGIEDFFSNDYIYEAPIRIAYMEEKTIFDTILVDSDINIYRQERIGSGLDEYINALTINKEIYKQAHALYKFVQLIKGRFVCEIDNFDQSLLYKQYEYTSLDNIIEDFDINNIYIHENEHLSCNNINRCLSKLYSLQESILNAVNTRVKNLSPN